MKIDIWSDVRCPFCYIGKHKFETALETFPQKKEIEIEWHSFELDPYLKTEPEKNAVEHLAEIKGISTREAAQMNQYAANSANSVNLEMNFEKVVVANSFKAHRLIQFAKTKGLGNEIEESLFKAHFTNGENIDDEAVLIRLGASIGLNKEEITDAFSSDKFSAEVRQDEAEAQRIGIHGVPFFIFNNRYAVSGAQAPAMFSQALTQSWDEYAKENKLEILKEGAVCDINGNCN